MLVLKLKRYGFYEVNFAGGEPLLDTHLGDYLVYAKSIGLKTSLITKASKNDRNVACIVWPLHRPNGFGNHVEVTKRAFTRIKALNAKENLNIKIKLNTVVIKTELPRRF
jgi:hypothetical protein